MLYQFEPEISPTLARWNAHAQCILEEVGGVVQPVFIIYKFLFSFSSSSKSDDDYGSGFCVLRDLASSNLSLEPAKPAPDRNGPKRREPPIVICMFSPTSFVSSQ